MALTYIDIAIKKNHHTLHPSMIVDEKHPCYRMVREVIDKKSTFHWTKSQAYQIYKWYVTGWNSASIEDEFGEGVPDYVFKDIIKNSHYLLKKNTPSNETIEEMWKAMEMQQKILDSAVQKEGE